MSTLIKDSNGDWKQAAGNYSVWSGTRAELEAALAGGAIPNGTVAVVTDDYAMQGVSCVPDWDHAVSVTAAQLYAGYTCPDNGMIVASTACKVSSRTDYFYINGAPVSSATGATQNTSYNTQCPVSDGDICTVTDSSTGVVFCKFVPWKK